MPSFPARHTLPTSSSFTRPIKSTTEDIKTNDRTRLQGMDCNTGQLITGIDYLRQRIRDAITTTKGSQVLLRKRGSELLGMVDSTMSQSGRLRLVGSIADALTHELAGLPDFIIKKIQFSDVRPEQGEYGFTLTANWLGNNVEVQV